ncbi:harmonin-like isoform X2 [Lytechinus pictus]|uniref:harmonin-like isoform X2 n=1 Tax=Lytechinus pictus TaxID=7653 RepID=UPI0030BA0BBA
MDHAVTQDFNNRVRATLEYEKDQAQLYSQLKKYKQDRDVASLVNTLKDLLASPDRVILFDDIRPFVSVNQQVEYNNLCPVPPSKKASLVHLTRRGGEPLGFKFRGGLEHGIGLFISEVTPGSQAEIKGLRPGDEIIQVNGYNVSQVTHHEALAAMKLKKMLTLKIKGIGLVPIKDTGSDPVSWQFVKTRQCSPERSPVTEITPSSTRNIIAKERTVFVNLEGGQKLGCGISSGRTNRPGIFIHKVNPGTLAEKLGFQVGDQIKSVNSTSFDDVSHAEALMALKSSDHLNIVLKSWEEDAIQIEPVQPSPHIKDADVPMTTAVVSGSGTGDAIRAAGLEDEKPKPTPKPTEKQPEWWTKDPYSMFTTRQIDDRTLKKVEIVKDGPLEMYLEGGLNTPLLGKVVVAEVLEGGAVAKSGAISKGDQILMLEGKKLIDVTLEEAQVTFKEHMKGKLDGSQKLRMIIAVAPAKNYEDEVTFF